MGYQVLEVYKMPVHYAGISQTPGTKTGRRKDCMLMKRKQRKSMLALCLIGALILSCADTVMPGSPSVSTAQADVINTTPEIDFTGELIDNVYTITKYTHNQKDDTFTPAPDTVVVPPVIEGNDVRAVKGIFSGNWTVKTVYLPDTITDIGDSSFAGCSVENIYSYPVTDALKNELNTLHAAAAAEAAAATPAPDGSTPAAKSKVGASFDTSTAVAGIPAGVTRIGENAFNNVQISSLAIPVAVKSIGNRAFNDTKLKDFTIPAGANVSSLGSTLFNGTLENITIDGHVDTISDKAFAYIASLKTFTVSTGASIGTIGRECFLNSGASDFNVTLWGHIDTMGDYAFSGSGGIQNLFIHDCTTIGSYAFSPCSIRNIIINGQISRIGDYAFAACGNVDRIEVSSLTDYTLGKYAFTCATIREVHFGDGLKVIEEGAFEKCGSLQIVYLPDSLESIGDNAFKDVSTIETFVISDELSFTLSVFGDAPIGQTLVTLQNSTNTSLQGLYGNPKKLKVKKVKYNKKKQLVTIKWTKASAASGYAVYTKTVAKGKKAKKVKWKLSKTTKNAKTTLKIKLNKKQKKALAKKGKIYFSVKAYTYTTVEGEKEKLYSDFSNAKFIKK